jgi:NAD(P)-dependent dehydrogenase (short-subunit alcohol dehydrogenase family)
MAVNVRGPMLCCHAVFPGMIAAGRGHVFNVNSLAGNRAMPTGSAYGVSKAALFRLTESLGAALQGTGVAIFDVSPGLVRTAMTKDLGIYRNVPEAEWIPPERIGELIVRLSAGGYEDLSGRFVHVKDDPDALLAAVRAQPASDLRRLRLVPADT